MAGLIALENAITPAILVVPLIPFTVWYSKCYFSSTQFDFPPKRCTLFQHFNTVHQTLTHNTDILLGYYFGRNYEPLMKFIALRSIEQISENNFADEERPSGIVRRQSTTVDESREKGQRFVNPSLVTRLEKMWIDIDSDEIEEPNDDPGLLDREQSTESTQSLGDAHIWRTPQ